MDRNFARSLSLVLKSEGGWSDNPLDNGGATMKGITIAVFRQYIDPKGTKDDLRNITDAQVATIYRKQYWDKVSGDSLPDGVDYATFDYAVNSGVSRASKHLQSVVGAVQDGKIGPATLAKTKVMMRTTVINDLCDKRMAFLKSLKTWGTFGRGWTSRVSSVRKDAIAMAAGGVGEAPKPIPATPEPPKAQPAPAAPPVAPPAPPKTGIAMFFAMIAAGLGIAWAWIAAAPCDWFGLFCK